MLPPFISHVACYPCLQKGPLRRARGGGVFTPNVTPIHKYRVSGPVGAEPHIPAVWKLACIIYKPCRRHPPSYRNLEIPKQMLPSFIDVTPIPKLCYPIHKYRVSGPVGAEPHIPAVRKLPYIIYKPCRRHTPSYRNLELPKQKLPSFLDVNPIHKSCCMLPPFIIMNYRASGHVGSEPHIYPRTRLRSQVTAVIDY